MAEKTYTLSEEEFAKVRHLLPSFPTHPPFAPTDAPDDIVATTHVTFVLDRSGSMESIRSDVVGGFNAFISEQQADARPCAFTLLQFDTQGMDYLHQDTSIHAVKPMQASDFLPRGGTPLLDAVGKAIADAAIRLERTRRITIPENQIVVVLTDGQENASTEYTKATLADLIARKEAEGWTFIYLAANVDAFSEARSMGFSQANTQNFMPDSVGTHSALASSGQSVSSLRSKTYAGDSYDNRSALASTAAQEDYEKRNKGKKAPKSTKR